MDSRQCLLKLGLCRHCCIWFQTKQLTDSSKVLVQDINSQSYDSLIPRPSHSSVCRLLQATNTGARRHGDEASLLNG